METYLEILKLYPSKFWGFFVVLTSYGFLYVLYSAFSLGISRLTIMLRGYPPQHTDINGIKQDIKTTISEDIASGYGMTVIEDVKEK